MNLDTIEHITNEEWEHPDSHAGYLVKTIFDLRRKPIAEFGIEDLRILIGQNVALDVLVPIAIKKLKENILTEGDYYPGDLLVSVLQSDASFWRKTPSLKNEIIAILERGHSTLNETGLIKKLALPISGFNP